MKGHVYCTGHGKNRLLSQAFAKGSGWPIVPPAPLMPGAVFMYGCLRGLKPTLEQAQAEGRTWYYADNGYFRPGRDGYFRVTRNALQHDGTGDAGSERWQRLRLNLKPWRKDGRHVVVCPPAPDYGELWGLDHRKWLRDVLETLQSVTDRQVVVRHRSMAGSIAIPLSAALANAWALVTCASNAAVEALLAGVPVFCTRPCAAYRMGKTNIAEIEEPALPDDREQWAWNLAANQWSVAEMASGECWAELERQCQSHQTIANLDSRVGW